jgi:hypothetical protein
MKLSQDSFCLLLSLPYCLDIPCDLFNDAVSSFDYIASDDNELGRIWKGVVMA